MTRTLTVRITQKTTSCPAWPCSTTTIPATVAGKGEIAVIVDTTDYGEATTPGPADLQLGAAARTPFRRASPGRHPARASGRTPSASYHRPMPMWRCPHCGTPQAEAARCWVCHRSTSELRLVSQLPPFDHRRRRLLLARPRPGPPWTARRSGRAGSPSSPYQDSRLTAPGLIGLDDPGPGSGRRTAGRFWRDAER